MARKEQFCWKEATSLAIAVAADRVARGGFNDSENAGRAL